MKVNAIRENAADLFTLPELFERLGMAFGAVAPPPVQTKDKQPGLDVNQEIIKEKSGYYRVATARNVYDDANEENLSEEEKEERKKLKRMQQTALIGGISMSVTEVAQNLEKVSDHYEDVAAKMADKAVITEDQIAMHNGQQIETRKSRLKLEAQAGDCPAVQQYSIEELTVDVNGNMVAKDTYEQSLMMQERADTAELYAEQLAKGEITVDQIPDDYQADVLEAHENGGEMEWTILDELTTIPTGVKAQFAQEVRVAPTAAPAPSYP